MRPKSVKYEYSQIAHEFGINPYLGFSMILVFEGA